MDASAQRCAAPAAVSSPYSTCNLRWDPLKRKLLHQQKQHVCLGQSGFHGRVLSIKPLVSQSDINGSANAPILGAAKLDGAPDESVSDDPAPTAADSAIFALMSDVANLVKLVDSRDIVELELKHSDYEIVIKKKEALTPPPAPPSLPQSQAIYPTPAPSLPPPQPLQAAAPSAPATTPAQPSPAPSVPPISPASDKSKILSPMAGTFYRCPAPGEPPMVKVGDKVQKGQVICIVEAMKLMNEIEADQSGTITEILAEDGKPVSVDTPLFSIKQ